MGLWQLWLTSGSSSENRLKLNITNMSSFIGSSNSDLVDFLDHFFLDDNALCCHPANNSKCTESVVEKVRVDRQSPDEGKKNDDGNKEKVRAKSDELLMGHEEADTSRRKQTIFRSNYSFGKNRRRY